MIKDGTPEWAYDEDNYCVCCGHGSWKYHTPDCELRDALDATLNIRRRDEAKVPRMKSDEVLPGVKAEELTEFGNWLMRGWNHGWVRISDV